MVRQETYMAINPIDAYKYQPVNNYSFGGLSGQRGQQVQGGPQGVGETNPTSNPFAIGNNEGLVGRLDKIDASQIVPNTQSETTGNRFYAIA